MKGKIEDIDSWTYDDVSNMLEEAGLRTDKENKEVYLTEEIDAVEVISVLESWYDVEVSMSEHMRLAKLMRRGFIGRAAMLGWLKRCNYKPVRKTRTHDMPLFEGQMTTAEAIDVLTEFNRWRRGEGKYAWNEDPAKNAECPYSPKAIGQAIDIAINEMNKGN